MQETFEKIYTPFFNQTVLVDSDNWDVSDGKVVYTKKSITFKEYFNLTDFSITLFSYLLNHLTDKNAKNFLKHFSYSNIAKKLGVEKNAVYENMKRLEKAKLLYWDKENNNKISKISLICIVPCEDGTYYEYEIETSSDVQNKFGSFGFIICPTKVLQSKDLTITEKINYSYISSYNNLKKGNSSFKSSMAGFAAFINRCRTSVMRILKSLQRKGLVFLDIVKQGIYTNWYTNISIVN